MRLYGQGQKHCKPNWQGRGGDLMQTMSNIDVNAMMQVTACYQSGRITKQQYRTLRGQVFAGNGDGALRGIRKILTRKGGAHESVCD